LEPKIAFPPSQNQTASLTADQQRLLMRGTRGGGDLVGIYLKKKFFFILIISFK